MRCRGSMYLNECYKGFVVISMIISHRSMSLRRDSMDSEVDSIDGPELFVPSAQIRDRSVSVGNESGRCILFGNSFPRTETRYFAQIFILYVVIFACLGNLSFGNGELNSLWITLLSSCIGLLLPSPHIPRVPRQTAQLDAVVTPQRNIP